MRTFKAEKGQPTLMIPHGNMRIVLHHKTPPALRHLMFDAFVRDARPREIAMMHRIVEQAVRSR